MTTGTGTPLLAAVVAELSTAEVNLKRELAAALQPYLGAAVAERFLDINEKAEQLRLHPDTLARMARSGRIPAATKVGREWRFPAGPTEILPLRADASVTVASKPSGTFRRRAAERTSVAAIRAARGASR